MRQAMEELIGAHQATICAELAALDGGATFQRDPWQREGGGGGITCVLQGGRVFEKAGVGVSAVEGVLSPEAAAHTGGGGALQGEEGRRFFACGLSLVLHPHHPMVPTVHANYRYFERGVAGGPRAWWFGGGSDLTPSYLFAEDARHFHQTLKDACDRTDVGFYPRFKAWCDRYFYIPHRGEARGVGGIFFDNLCDRPPEVLLGFVADCLQAFLPSYLPVVQRRLEHPYGDAERAWQRLRRGRYVEFNLVYDRGTSFGLRTGGRVESILMSLPAVAGWTYQHSAPPGGPEAEMQAVLVQPRAWLSAPDAALAAQ